MKKDYFFDERRFVIKNYADKPPFTDFLPGIAGLNGRPLWAFFVNRGQGIAGFGVSGKELPIMEFSPAEIAYVNAPRQGFRTFLRIDGKTVEPFRVGGKAKTTMSIERSGFGIIENTKKYELSVEYFGVPNRDYAALGRIVTYKNNTDKAQVVGALDGLAQILPYGMSNSSFKETGNLLKSWMVAEGTPDGYAFIKMRSSTADTAEVSGIDGGNFFLPVGDYRVVVDPALVFGEDRTKTAATEFGRKGMTDEAIKAQRVENELFCAFANAKATVGAGQTLTLCELIGYADNIDKVSGLKRTLTVSDIIAMREEAREEAEKIARAAATHTAFPQFDEYVEQSYFDNVLRGGMPVTVGGKPYYVFSRKHGDPERDYNAFHIEPKPYSCGTGNFRDVAQNRRNDPLITPECGDFNIRYFFSLLQADGYNPLSVLGVRFTCCDVPERFAAYKEFLNGKFTVGDAVVTLGLKGKALDELMSVCKPVCEAGFGEGFWTDHFTYLIDLVTTYLAVYPDKNEELLFGSKLRWFKAGVRVLPRSRRAVRNGSGKIRRLYSIEKSGSDGWLKSGDRDYRTSLAAKLLFLALIKLATLDPLGCGIDMEAGKPGWCDATNGLPALFGSNVADGLDLLRLVGILEELLKDCDENIVWASEQHALFESALDLLDRNVSSEEFYNEINDCKEKYLRGAYDGFGGETAKVSAEEARAFLAAAKKKLRRGMEKAKELGGGWLPTYLAFEPTESRDAGDGYVLPTAFEARALPHFAEGIAKGLGVGESESYETAKHSALYDGELGLFKTSEPLDGESMEIGRIRSFPAGWLERESCFLHMSYKLLLALLDAGKYDEFYTQIKTGLVPFMPAERYGRSTLENSSFIVTSNHSDKRKWGKGYQARLTGANAEVLSMWRVMMGIEKPFTVENGELKFELSPKLHKDFFDGGRASFTLFGKTKVTYVNGGGKNGWECVPASYTLKGERTEKVKTVTGELAQAVRNGQYTEIEVELI